MGINRNDLILALVITQFVGVPFSILFGRISKKIGAKRAILIAILIYTFICVGGYYMKSSVHFYLLAFFVGTVQGGSQALSRSLFGSMVPKAKAAEFFGFFSTSSKFAGIAGPLIFGLISQIAGSSRLSIIFLIFFFITGGILLTKISTEPT